MTSSEYPINDNSATGDTKNSSEEFDDAKTILYPFGPYEIKIRLSLDGKFKEVLEVRINKDFRNYSQRIASTGHHDVEQYYDND